MSTASLKLPQSNSDLFYKYLDSCKDKVKSKHTEGYYPVNVVAEAYTKGFNDGKKSGKKDFIKDLLSKKIENFTQKANQIYILSKTVVSMLNDKGYTCSALYINLTYDRPSVIISLPNKFLNNDECIEAAYLKINENKKIYSKLFGEALDLGLISSDNIEESLLEEDGFGYKEIY